MSTLNKTMRWSVATLGLASLAAVALPLVPQRASAAEPGDPAFSRVWSRTDKPVEARMAARSWTWGPTTFNTAYEPYIEGPGGQHIVSYYDKARMEINNPAADRNSQWFVTNGLLVVDMIAGRVQTGDDSFAPATPANIPVAGDTATSINAPTYASLKNVASLNGDHRAANRTGQAIREGLGPTGNLGTVDNLAGYANYQVYEPTTGHNIANVFWAFLNQSGVVYQDGKYTNGTLVDWLFAMGYPITEPYWIQINVGGQDRWVLMQAFQRRILTYSPQNPLGWQVEMANVGRAYYDWRYGQAPTPVPTSTPTRTPTPRVAASISISPANGSTSTSITINGKGFPAFAAVTIGVEDTEAGYSRNLAVIAAKADGSFGTKINLPDDAAKLGAVTITAKANGGAISTGATFTLNYSPSISTAPAEVVTNGVVAVQGDGFPANANIDLGVQFNGAGVQWLARIKSDNDGSFEANLPIGARAAGSTFKVFAVSDGGFKATAKTTHTVLAQPGLQVIPGSGPAGTNVTLRGTNWPAFRSVTIGSRSIDSAITGWRPNPITADINGRFDVTVYVGPEYGDKSEVRLIAFEPISTFRMEASYRVVSAPTPTPIAATIAVAPSVLAIGQTATVSGSNWQASAIVQVGVGRPGYGVEEWLGSARTTGNRTFSMPFVLGPQWVNTGQLVITAVIPANKTATTTISVVHTTGRITPGGLPMTVNTYSYGGLTQLKINGNGWRPGSMVHISVVSANGSVIQEIGNVVVNDRGILSTAIDETGPWVGRADLGVKATTLDSSQYSIRYLPVTTAVKQQDSSNTYVVTGFNWPANSTINVAVGTADGPKGEGGVIRTITTDANGAFNFTVNIPRLPANSKTDLELRSQDQPYSATFDF